jgi:hypothetical protein
MNSGSENVGDATMALCIVSEYRCDEYEEMMNTLGMSISFETDRSLLTYRLVRKSRVLTQVHCDERPPSTCLHKWTFLSNFASSHWYPDLIVILIIFCCDRESTLRRPLTRRCKDVKIRYLQRICHILASKQDRPWP